MEHQLTVVITLYHFLSSHNPSAHPVVHGESCCNNEWSLSIKEEECFYWCYWVKDCHVATKQVLGMSLERLSALAGSNFWTGLLKFQTYAKQTVFHEWWFTSSWFGNSLTSQQRTRIELTLYSLPHEMHMRYTRMHTYMYVYCTDLWSCNFCAPLLQV